MEHSKNQENGLNKSHFTKLHNRIVNKYIEVQKKLHKHRSVDSLCDSDSLDSPSLNELSKSTGDLFNELFETEDFNKSDATKCELSHENIQSLVNHPEVIDLSSSQSSLVIVDGETDNNSIINNQINKDSILSSSSESINETVDADIKIKRKSNSTKTVKFSFRDRIGIRIANAKERRRKRSIEKNAAKAREETEKFSLASYSSLTMSNRKKTKVGVVAIAIIEASGWNNEIFLDKQRQLYFRLRLGNEKLKSKVQKTVETTLTWKEEFNLNLYDDTLLELFLFDREVLVGRTAVYLMELEKEKTHQMRLNLVEGELDFDNVQIFILITISGTPDQNLELGESQSIRNILKENPWDYSKLGQLHVKIYGAKGLPSSDYYCCLDFGNERRLTPVDSKTQDPTWLKAFNFLITDITELLVFTIHDNRNKEQIAKVTIPLLKIEKQKRFYTLKDTDQKDRAQGNNPRILLEMSVSWNVAKASIRVINPREQIFMESVDRFDRHVFTRNFARGKAVYVAAVANFHFWKACFEWESRLMNIVGLSVWIPFCWNFKLWMFPLIICIPFLWNTLNRERKINPTLRSMSTASVATLNSEKDTQSLVQKLNNLQDLIQNVQNVLGDVARLGERVKNLYNFTEPFLSWLAIFWLLFITLILYFIPARIIFIAWGIKKFMFKIWRPNRIKNNEVLDLLSRVPDEQILMNCEELPLL